MATFPRFLRFNEIQLEYNAGLQTLSTKCRFFEDCLDSIKPALKDSYKICFFADINSDCPHHFIDHSSVCIYLRHSLLPICNASRRYEFHICFESNEYASDQWTEFISSILQISQVRTCSHVCIQLVDYNRTFAAQFPVEDISHWLAPKTDDGGEICGKKEQNRFLRIFADIIPNTQEMWDHLKEVI